MNITQSKISEVASVTTGLVVKRKQAQLPEDIVASYKMLTLRCFDQDGKLNTDELEIFSSNEKLESKYLTQLGDVVVRLSSPHTAVTIGQDLTGLLIPSLFVVIRLQSDLLMPEYLGIYLNCDYIKKHYARSSIGSAIQIIQASMLREIVLRIPDLDHQQRTIQINQLFTREKVLIEKLLEEKANLHTAVLKKLL